MEGVFAGEYKVRRARLKLCIAFGETLDGRLAFVVFRRLSGGLVRVIMAERRRSIFENHSVAGVWDQLPATPQAKPLPALAKKIRDRHARAKSPISLRLAPEQIAATKHIAAAKSVGYQTQLRMWVAEGIRREAKRA